VQVISPKIVDPSGRIDYMENQGMKKAAVVVMILSGLLAGICLSAQQGPGGRAGGGGSPGGTGANPGEAGASGGSPIAVARVSEQSHSITVGGRLEPQSRIVHKISTGGYVQTVLVREGQMVEAGEELLSLRRKDDVMELYKPVPLNARISGRVSEVLVQPEAEVNAGDSAVVILGTEGYVLEANVSDKDAFRIDVGQPVTGRTADSTPVSGFLLSRSQEPDYSTGLFELTFQFPNSQRVSVGEFVLIDLPIDRVRGLFVLRDVVVRRYGKFFLWIVNESQVLEAREVALGPVFGDLVLIRDGLKPGERYLVRLTGREREGAPVAGAPVAGASTGNPGQ
jgi:multidrug efflux pump subunit AcrA (membrane-fusion protein)